MPCVMYVISMSLVPGVGVSGTVCSLILTILHSLKLLANCRYISGLEVTCRIRRFINWHVTYIHTYVHHRADIYSNNGPTQQCMNYYDMPERTLIELTNPHIHDTPITMQLSTNPDTAELWFWYMFTAFQVQFQCRCRLNYCICNRQPIRFAPFNYAVRYQQ